MSGVSNVSEFKAHSILPANYKFEGEVIMSICIKRFVSLILILILLIICNITVFATGSMDEQRAEDIDTEIHILTDINELPGDTIIIAEATAPITISATAEQFRAAGLEPPQGPESKAAIVQLMCKP